MNFEFLFSNCFWLLCRGTMFLHVDFCQAIFLSFIDVQPQSNFWFCDHMDSNIPGLSVLQYIPEFAQTHVHWVSDAIQTFHPLMLGKIEDRRRGQQRKPGVMQSMWSQRAEYNWESEWQ